MYGLWDAGASFDRKVLDVMNLMGVSLGKFIICVGYRKVMTTLGQVGALWGDGADPPGAEGGERWELEADLDTLRFWSHRWAWATKAKQ